MAGPGYTVSYAAWTNPYTGTSTAGQAFYSTTTTSQQPVVRRLAPPTPAYSYRYPGVSYSYGNSESEEEEEEDSDDGGAPLMSGALPEAPEAPSAAEAINLGTEEPSAPAPAPASEPAPQENTPAEEPPPEPVPSVPADATPVPSEESKPEDPVVADSKVEPSNLTAAPVETEPSPPTKEAPPEVSTAEEAPVPQEEIKTEEPVLETAPDSTVDVQSQPQPAEASATETALADAAAVELVVESEPVPPPPPPPPAPPGDAALVSVIVDGEKSGESEQAAQEPPKSPKPHEEKTVHFASDTKDPDSPSNGKKKKLKIIGKGKPNAFVRVRDPPPPPAPSSPKEEKKHDKGKKKERRGSFLSISSVGKDEKHATSKEEHSGSSKKKLSKSEERKRKKHEKKDRKAAVSEPSLHVEEKSVEAEEDAPSEVAASTVTAASTETASESSADVDNASTSTAEDTPAIDSNISRERPEEQAGQEVQPAAGETVEGSAPATVTADIVHQQDADGKDAGSVEQASEKETNSEPVAETGPVPNIETTNGEAATSDPAPTSQETSTVDEQPAVEEPKAAETESAVEEAPAEEKTQEALPEQVSSAIEATSTGGTDEPLLNEESAPAEEPTSIEATVAVGEPVSTETNNEAAQAEEGLPVEELTLSAGSVVTEQVPAAVERPADEVTDEQHPIETEISGEDVAPAEIIPTVFPVAEPPPNTESSSIEISPATEEAVAAEAASPADEIFPSQELAKAVDPLSSTDIPLAEEKLSTEEPPLTEISPAKEPDPNEEGTQDKNSAQAQEPATMAEVSSVEEAPPVEIVEAASIGHETSATGDVDTPEDKIPVVMEPAAEDSIIQESASGTDQAATESLTADNSSADEESSKGLTVSDVAEAQSLVDDVGISASETNDSSSSGPPETVPISETVNPVDLSKTADNTGVSGIVAAAAAAADAPTEEGESETGGEGSDGMAASEDTDISVVESEATSVDDSLIGSSTAGGTGDGIIEAIAAPSQTTDSHVPESPSEAGHLDNTVAEIGKEAQSPDDNIKIPAEPSSSEEKPAQEPSADIVPSESTKAGLQESSSPVEAEGKHDETETASPTTSAESAKAAENDAAPSEPNLALAAAPAEVTEATPTEPVAASQSFEADDGHSSDQGSVNEWDSDADGSSLIAEMQNTPAEATEEKEEVVIQDALDAEVDERAAEPADGLATTPAMPSGTSEDAKQAPQKTAGGASAEATDPVTPTAHEVLKTVADLNEAIPSASAQTPETATAVPSLIEQTDESSIGSGDGADDSVVTTTPSETDSSMVTKQDVKSSSNEKGNGGDADDGSNTEPAAIVVVAGDGNSVVTPPAESVISAESTSSNVEGPSEVNTELPGVSDLEPGTVEDAPKSPHPAPKDEESSSISVLSAVDASLAEEAVAESGPGASEIEQSIADSAPEVSVESQPTAKEPEAPANPILVAAAMKALCEPKSMPDTDEADVLAEQPTPADDVSHMDVEMTSDADPAASPEAVTGLPKAEDATDAVVETTIDAEVAQPPAVETLKVESDADQNVEAKTDAIETAIVTEPEGAASSLDQAQSVAIEPEPTSEEAGETPVEAVEAASEAPVAPIAEPQSTSLEETDRHIEDASEISIESSESAGSKDTAQVAIASPAASTEATEATTEAASPDTEAAVSGVEQVEVTEGEPTPELASAPAPALGADEEPPATDSVESASTADKDALQTSLLAPATSTETPTSDQDRALDVEPPHDPSPIPDVAQGQVSTTDSEVEGASTEESDQGTEPVTQDVTATASADLAVPSDVDVSEAADLLKGPESEPVNEAQAVLKESQEASEPAAEADTETANVTAVAATEQSSVPSDEGSTGAESATDIGELTEVRTKSDAGTEQCSTILPEEAAPEQPVLEQQPEESSDAAEAEPDTAIVKQNEADSKPEPEVPAEVPTGSSVGVEVEGSDQPAIQETPTEPDPTEDINVESTKPPTSVEDSVETTATTAEEADAVVESKSSDEDIKTSAAPSEDSVAHGIKAAPETVPAVAETMDDPSPVKFEPDKPDDKEDIAVESDTVVSSTDSSGIVSEPPLSQKTEDELPQGSAAASLEAVLVDTATAEPDNVQPPAIVAVPESVEADGKPELGETIGDGTALEQSAAPAPVAANPAPIEVVQAEPAPMEGSASEPSAIEAVAIDVAAVEVVAEEPVVENSPPEESVLVVSPEAAAPVKPALEDEAPKSSVEPETSHVDAGSVESTLDENVPVEVTPVGPAPSESPVDSVPAEPAMAPAPAVAVEVAINDPSSTEPTVAEDNSGPTSVEDVLSKVVSEDATSREVVPNGAVAAEEPMTAEDPNAAEPSVVFSATPEIQVAQEVTFQRLGAEETLSIPTQQAALPVGVSVPGVSGLGIELVEPAVSPPVERSMGQAEAIDSAPAIDAGPAQPPAAAEAVFDPTPKTHDFAVSAESPRHKHHRRHSQSRREGKHHSHHRHESDASTKERPSLPGAAALSAAKPLTSLKNKRRDSTTDRDLAKSKARTREAEPRSSPSREPAYPEVRSHRHRESREPAYPDYSSERPRRGSKTEDKQTKRRPAEPVLDEDAERRKRREARRAEKERLAAEEAARLEEEEVQRQLRREQRRAAKLAEAEAATKSAEAEAAAKLQEEEMQRRQRREQRRAAKLAEEEQIKQQEADRIFQEEEARRARHEKRRQRYEAEKEARRLEKEKAEQQIRDEQEVQRAKRHRRAEKEREKLETSKSRRRDAEAPRDAARRAAEEEDSASPAFGTIEAPRSTPRRMSTRGPPPATPKRGSFLGGLFSRSKTESATPSSKPTTPRSRPRAETLDAIDTPATILRKEREHHSSSNHSSNESRERGDRPRRSRRHSHNHHSQRFASAEEEADHYHRRAKEERRAARSHEHDKSGAHDGGIPLEPAAPLYAPPPIPKSVATMETATMEVERQREPDYDHDNDAEPMAIDTDSPAYNTDDAGAVLGISSGSERRERRESHRTRRVSILDERPNRNRRVAPGSDKGDRPVSKRVQSERSRAKVYPDERPRAPRRAETERRSTRTGDKKRSGEGGLKGLFGGFLKKS